MATKIKKKPSLAVKNLSAPTRGNNNHVMTATWKIPNDLISTSKNNRAEGLDIDWFLGIAGKDPDVVRDTKNEKQTTSSINLNNLKIGKKTYTRNSFYPNTKTKLSYVTVKVVPTNKKGSGKPATATRKFVVPRTPSLTALSFNTDNGVISTTINTDAGLDYAERYDTKYTMTVTNPFKNGGKAYNSSDSSSTSTSFNVTYDASDYMRLDPDTQFIKVVAKAYARGYAGNSKTVSRTEYISYPAQATIQGVDVSSRDATGKCTVRIKTNSTTEHPVDKVRLEIAADVTYDDANGIPANEWESTEIIDNKNCTALSIATSELIPSRGNYSYVRVVTYHLHEGVLYRYSKPWRVTELEVPTAPPASINIEILEAHTGADGKSAVVLLGWNKDGQDDYTGTELSWSDDENTWKSTDEPSTHQFTWSDGEIEYGGVTYHDSAEITIKGLNEGEKYYIKARRYLEADNEQYSAYSNTATALTSEIPESIVASCDRYIADGNPLSVYWTFAGNGIQTEWQIVRVAQYVKTKDEAVLALAVAEPVNDDLFKYYELSGTTYTLTSDTSVVEGKDYYIINKTYYTKSGEVYTAVTSPSDSSVSDYYEFYDNTVVAEGKGSAGATQISAERLAEMAIDNSLTFIVQASTGSGFVSSEEHTVTIIEQPTLQITGSSLVHVHEEDEQTYTGDIELTTAEVLVDGDFLQTNDLSINFKSNQLCDLITIVTSQGATGQFPQGVLMQANGDTIHSDVYSPEWTESNGDLTSTINLPTGLDFWDGGTYTASVVAVDRTTGLRSPEVTLTVPVMWANQAVPPEQASYSLTTDTTVVEDEAYYEKVGDDYILVTPVGTENPSSEGWYTQNITSFVTLTVIDEKDSDGDHTQAVRIALTPPTGSRESDVYDIYRMDIENPSLIGEGFPLTYTAVDEYAPFGKDVELKYRIAVRTVDGDVAFSDIEYEADCENIRFDWSGGSLELPYGNTVGDSFSKDTEIRKHMNGVSNGYWNQGVERKSSLSSNIIKIVQPRDIERARMLARYAGAVFVRLPNGSAFEADVQVTDLSIKNEAVTAVAFDATEIGLTQEFSLPTPFRLEE